MKEEIHRIRFFVFLGNPGRQYAETRHNAGWMVCDNLSFINSSGWKEKFNALFRTVIISGSTLIFLKPQTFMNNCGQAVQKALNFFNLDPKEMLVVHDDLETPFGSIALKKGGGLGGHNGLKSIKQNISSSDFFRLKTGISRPSGIPPANWVLQPFSADEKAVLPHVLDKAAELVTGFAHGDIMEKDQKIRIIER